MEGEKAKDTDTRPPVCDSFKCTITGTSSRLGDRAFAAAGPRLWDSLHAHGRRLAPIFFERFVQQAPGMTV